MAVTDAVLPLLPELLFELLPELLPFCALIWDCKAANRLCAKAATACCCADALVSVLVVLPVAELLLVVPESDVDVPDVVAVPVIPSCASAWLRAAVNLPPLR